MSPIFLTFISEFWSALLAVGVLLGCFFCFIYAAKHKGFCPVWLGVSFMGSWVFVLYGLAFLFTSNALECEDKFEMAFRSERAKEHVFNTPIACAHEGRIGVFTFAKSTKE